MMNLHPPMKCWSEMMKIKQKFSKLLSFLERHEEVQADLKYELEDKLIKFLNITPRHLIIMSNQYESRFDYKKSLEMKVDIFWIILTILTMRI